MQYTIEIGEQTLAVDVQSLGSGRYQIKIGDGEPRVLDAQIDGPLVHILEGSHSSSVRLAGGSAYLDGQTAPLTTLDARTARLRARSGGSQRGGGLVIRSPMPGRVVKVLVNEGDVVTPGQGIVIVEAMKMENELRADSAGIVDTIKVGAGDLVEGDAELVLLRAQ